MASKPAPTAPHALHASSNMTVLACSQCHHALHSVVLVHDTDDKHYIHLTCGHCTNAMQFQVQLVDSPTEL